VARPRNIYTSSATLTLEESACMAIWCRRKQRNVHGSSCQESDIFLQLQTNLNFSLMLIPCIIRRIRRKPKICTDCTTPIFYVLAPTCFGSSLPSPGSYWILLSYVKYKRRSGISYNVLLRGLCAGLSWFHATKVLGAFRDHVNAPKNSSAEQNERSKWSSCNAGFITLYRGWSY
jgi:hypothetical protein